MLAKVCIHLMCYFVSAEQHQPEVLLLNISESVYNPVIIDYHAKRVAEKGRQGLTLLMGKKLFRFIAED